MKLKIIQPKTPKTNVAILHLTVHWSTDSSDLCFTIIHKIKIKLMGTLPNTLWKININVRLKVYERLSSIRNPKVAVTFKKEREIEIDR